MKTDVILVVDDTETLLKLTKGIFELAGYSVRTAEDGEKALEILRETKIDLVVTDILMPNTDGYILCYTIRTTERFRDIPVIIYSATYTSSSDETMAMEIGADKFIRKPASMGTLTAAAEELLLRKSPHVHKIPARPTSLEASRLYNEGLVSKLERRNIELEKIKIDLEQNELLLNEAQRISHLGSWELNMMTNERLWSNEMFNVLGLDKNTVKPSHEIFMSHVHPDDLAFVKSSIDHVLLERTNIEIDFRFIRLDGLVRHGFLKCRYFFDLIGTPNRLIGIFQDVTEAKGAEVQKEFDANNLKALINNTQDMMWSVDREFRLITSNHAFDEVASQLSGMRLVNGSSILAQRFNEAQLKTFRRNYERAFAGEIFTEVEFTGPPLEMWSEISYYPIYRGNEVVGTACFSRDITKQKNSENHLRMLESVITNASDAVLITDAFPIDPPGPKIVFVNQAFTDMTGYRPEEVLGKTPRLLQGFKTDRLQLDLVRQALTNGQRVEVELVNYRKNQDEFWTNFIIVPIADNESKITHHVSIQRDVSARRQMEEDTRKKLEHLVEERTTDLKEALSKEKELVQMKDKFVSIASHEFRTPLATISLAAESIRNYFHQLSSEEITRKLAKIEDQASHMTNLLEDILTLGKSEAGKIKMKKISLDLKEFIETLIEEIKSPLKQPRDIVYAHESKRRMVNMDDKLLRNVVTNLLTNALKFSLPATSVFISVRDKNGDIVIKVVDKGIGIPEDEVVTVFESFQRGSNAVDIQGTGLGLSILKKAVELMNGSIKIESEVNKGSTFVVTLPIQ